MQANITRVLHKISLYTFFALLAYMPLHIFLSTWLGSSLGLLEIAKVLKDIILILGFVVTVALSVNKPWFKEVLKTKLLWLIGLYALIHVTLAINEPVDQDAEILGLVYNLRFLVYFIYGFLLTRLFSGKNLQSMAVKTVVAVGIVVSLFGVLQYTILPNNALNSVGYSRENGVLPAFFIDDKPDLERVMSTVRDPNSLGSYLIIVAMVVVTVLFATKRRETKKMMIGALLLSVLCLLLTFSRSALLGLIVAGIVFAAVGDNPIKRYLITHRIKFAAGFVTLAVVFGSLFIALKDSYYVQNVVFHADQTTVLEDPNELRLRFMQESLFAIFMQPEGTGPGTAGLASIRNDKQGTVLNENYYLQIGTEVGILGLLVFLLICLFAAYALFRRRAYTLPVALLAAFAGLAITNMLVHIWSNEAVAYTWWGLAGLMLIKPTSKISQSS